MPHSRLQQVWPAPAADLTPERMTLDALRHEIDSLDAEMLALFERRLALADRVGRAKDAPAGPHLKLRPDREADVLARLTGRAGPANREAVAAVWREVVGAGLARQTPLTVRIWAGANAVRVADGARRRFGASAACLPASGAEAALAFADSGAGVAVLAVDPDQPWWVDLPRRWPDLWVFDALAGARGPDQPCALALGRIDPQALARGRRISVTAGGDAGEGPRRIGLATHHGWTLALLAEGGPPLDRAAGVVGTAP